MQPVKAVFAAAAICSMLIGFALIGAALMWRPAGAADMAQTARVNTAADVAPPFPIAQR